MKIALIGYGKMGRAIEEIAVSRGHQVVLKIDAHNESDLNADTIQQADVAIEFTGPDSAFENVLKCLQFRIPVVCGSTGWLENWPQIISTTEELQGAVVYASNFSVGVNIFFELNKKLAELMAPQEEYHVSLVEIHHTQKKDAPSGTAVSLAEQVIEKLPRKNSWVNQTSNDPQQLEIISERIDPAPGTHKVLYTSSVDDIEIIHTAHNRTGFATGAVLAAEFILGRQGIFGMKEVLGL